MALPTQLPHIADAAIDSNGRLNPRFYNALQQALSNVQTQSTAIDSTNSDVAAVNAAVDALNLAIGSLKYLANDGLVTKAGSVYSARTLQDTTTIGWTNPAGILGNPSADFIGTTDNVPEGVTNLYFTDARAQAASLNSVFFADILQTETGAALISEAGDIMTVD